MATENSATMGDYALLLRRQWAAVLAVVVVSLALAAAWTLVASKTYTSKTSVLVMPIGVDSASGSGSRASAEINMDTEAQIVTSTDVVQGAAAELGYGGDLRELAQRVSITVPPNTEILEIGYSGGTAVEAQRGADAFADAYLGNRAAGEEARLAAQRESLQARIGDLDERLDTVTQAIADAESGSASRTYNQAQASSLNDQLGDLGAQLNELDAVTVTPGRVITEGSLPAQPSSPDALVNLAAGAVLGLLAGTGIAVLRQRADHHIRRPVDVVRRTGVAVVAELPAAHERAHIAAAGSPEGRGYARVRNVVTGSAPPEARVVLVAGVSGPAPSVAANLAASLARSGEKTVLVCGDVDASTETDLLGDAGRLGLAEVLAGRVAAGAALRRVPGLPELRVLGPGGNASLAAELLETSNPGALLAELRAEAAWVVVAAPDTNSGADAQSLARFSDLALVVVQTDRTTARDVVDARAQFESMQTTVLGAVVVPGPSKERGRDRGSSATHDRAADDGARAPAPAAREAAESRNGRLVPAAPGVKWRGPGAD